MEFLATHLAKFLSEKDEKYKKNFEIYKYGFQLGIEMLCCCFLCGIIAIWTHTVQELIVFLFTFSWLRLYVGGIHLKNYSACLILSCIVISSSIFISSKITEINLLIHIVIVILLYSIKQMLTLFPDEKEAPNERVYFNNKYKRACFGIVASSIFLLYIKKYSLVVTILCVIFIVWISLIVERIYTKVKGDKKDE